MGRELDAKVAQAMGWVRVSSWTWNIEDGEVWRWRLWAPDEQDEIDGEDYRIAIPEDKPYLSDYWCAGVPLYSADIAAARIMEDWIEEYGSRLRYALTVMAGFLYTDDPVPDTDEALWWALLHATPEQRCLAFLAAMGK